jgi:hypothetical protein
MYILRELAAAKRCSIDEEGGGLTVEFAPASLLGIMCVRVFSAVSHNELTIRKGQLKPNVALSQT